MNYHLLSLAESLHALLQALLGSLGRLGRGEDWYLHTPILPLGILQCSRKMQTRKAKSCAGFEYQKELKVKHPSLMSTRLGKALV